MRWGLVACVLIACGSKGAVIEIHTTADHVKVYASAGDCEIDNNGTSVRCPGAIAWATSGPKARVDQSFQLLDGFPIKLQVTGGVASLELRAGTSHDQLDRIVAIGYDANNTPIAAARIVAPITIPEGDREVWRLDLQPAEDIAALTDPEAPPRGGITERVHAWGADSTPYCLAWQQYDGTAWTREVIAPGDDHDCDGFDGGTSVECNDFWFQFKQTTTGGVCTTSMGSGTGSACTVGMQTGSCSDGSGGSGSCVQDMNPIYCVPDVICAACPDPLDQTCPSTQYDTPGSPAPSFGCLIPADTTTGTAMPCTTGSSTASALLPVACTQVLLTSRELPPVTVIAQNGATFVDNGATFGFHVSNPTSVSCEIDLTWNGGLPLQSLYQYTLNVYVDVNGTTRALVIPISYQITNQTPCDAKTQCTPALNMGGTGSGSGDAMWDCLGA